MKLAITLRLIKGCDRYLGCDELREITADKWDDEIWGITSPTLNSFSTASDNNTPDFNLSSPTENIETSQYHSSDPPSSTGNLRPMSPVPLYFLFAQFDHWIAEDNRAALIRARAYDPSVDGDRRTGAGRKKPHMEIDDQIGMGHAFCLSKCFHGRSSGGLR